MSLAACAGIVRKGDNDRFLATMTGDAQARARLFPLYAFNLEIARAPYVTADPVIAAMRLQFWREVVEAAAAGEPPRAHEVATPLAALIRTASLPGAPFEAMIAAREAEAAGARGDITDFARTTGGSLMVLAGRALGAAEDAEPALDALGTASGLANWLLALPALRRAGHGFAPPPPDAVRRLADAGLAALTEARAAAALADKRLAPALRTAWRAPATLARAARNPQSALDGSLATSEFRRRLSLLARSATGRW